MGAQTLVGGSQDRVLAGDFRGVANTQVLGATFVLKANSSMLQVFDCNGAGRNVDLPAEADSEGKVFIIHNLTAATFAITLRNPAAGTVISIAATKAAIAYCANGVWRALGGA